jgi:hypothetical protein
MINNGLDYKIFAFVAALALFLGTIMTVNAITVPLGAQSIIEGYDQTVNLSNYAPAWHDAFAGNITELNLTGRTQTKHWQGYWGEITGTIILDDAQNWTLYTWNNMEPKGEIYATVNDTPDWQNIACFNYTGGADGTGLGNITAWEIFYNITYNDVDGIDETFNETSHIPFDVGDQTIFQDTCWRTYTYMNDAYQTDKFLEVLLSDPDGRLIFTTLIENDDNSNNTDIVGYNGQTHDFQMLVAEDGTSRVGGFGGPINLATTRYYFYVDLQ